MAQASDRAVDERVAGMKRQRTCIACGAHRGKDGLQRIVRASDGTVSFDATGKAAGRGAYVCSIECFEKMKKNRGLDRALKTKVSAEDYERVAEQMRQTLRNAEDR